MSRDINHGKGPDAFERALRQTVRSGTDAPATACPEPELLASYFERSLSSAESALWEKHFSACTRCQQQLAALARSEPAVEESATAWAWLRSPHLVVRWLAPAALALGAVALWFAIRPTPTRVDQITQEIPNQVSTRPELTREAAVPAPQSSAKGDAAAAGSGEPQVDQLATSKPSETSQKKLADELVASLPEERRKISEMPPSASPSLTAKNEAAPPAPVPSKPAQSQAPSDVITAAEEKQDLARDAAARREADRVLAAPARQAELGQVQPAAPSTVGATGGVRAASDERKTQARESEAATADSQLQKQSIPAFAAKVGEVSSGSVRLVISAPGGSVVWQIGIGGGIQRSADSGKTWTRQDSGVQTELTNGQAASAAVCWLVGLKGTVLRTTDGLHWQKVTFPLETDLVRIEAPDELHAVVTAAAGQTYATENGGKSWQKR
jgi:hypothetical protein